MSCEINKGDKNYDMYIYHMEKSAKINAMKVETSG